MMLIGSALCISFGRLKDFVNAIKDFLVLSFRLVY
jgi:hypothetical protein